MGDLRSDSSYEATVEEGVVGVKGNTTTLNQISSSGRAAQSRRTGKAPESLGNAAKEHRVQEQNDKDGSGKGQAGQGKAGKK